MSNINIVKKPKNPCGRFCADREPGCAVTCAKWQRYEEQRNAFYKQNLERKEQARLTHPIRNWEK